MKKRLLYLGFFLFINLILFSCTENITVRHYNLNIELNEPIPVLRENDPLPQYLKVLVNYIDTNCTNDLLVPNVTFIRNDIKQPNTHILNPPLTFINNFRNSYDMLPAEFLKEDYDKLIGGLTTPKILVEPKGTIKNINTAEDKNNAFVLNISKTDSLAISILKQKIVKRLCASKGNVTICIEVINVTHPDSTIPALTITSLNYNVPKEDGKQVITVKSNINWEVKCNRTWCNLNISSGTGNGSVIANYDANSNVEQRSAALIFSGVGVSNQTVIINQAGAVPPPTALNVTPTNQDVTNTASSTTFTITSNVSWTAQSDQAWCRISNTSGTGNAILAITCDANSTSSQRVAKLTVTGLRLQTKVVSITQQGEGNQSYPSEEIVYKAIPSTMLKIINLGNDIYKGEVKNNLPDGLGVLTFINARQISAFDLKKSMAESGDQLRGNWSNGEPTLVELYDSKGKFKNTFSFGSSK